MRLYHTTPIANAGSITATGIDPAFSTGARKEVWLHCWSKLPWAIAHVAAKYQASRVNVYAVDVPRRELTRRKRGLWTCARVVPPSSLVVTATTDKFTFVKPTKEVENV